MKFRKRKILSEEEIDEKFAGVEFEKNDALALVLAALVTFIPVILLIAGIFVAIVWLIF